MTLIFSGHSFKYETEAVVKLFFPAEHFQFIFLSKNADERKNALMNIKTSDYIFLRQKSGKKNTHFFIECFLQQILYRKTSNIAGSQKSKNQLPPDENLCELSICRLLFLSLRQITGIFPKWGMMTGIRPVKLVHHLLQNGYEKENIFQNLSQKYLTTPEKLELAYQTALIQKPLLTPPPRSFSLYVSIPWCPTRCQYCSFVSHSVESMQTRKLIPAYLEKLKEEIAVTADIASTLNLSLDTIYFGGGTPTILSAEQLADLMETIQRCFHIHAVQEYTVEAGRADTITLEKLQAIYENGGKRISINPQTFSDEILRQIGRNHTVRQVMDAFDLARSVGFECINMDFIAGLPGDSLENFMQTIQKACDLKPENITVHTLSLKRSSALYQQQHSQIFHSDVDKMITFSQTRLSQNGYQPYYLYRQKNMAGNLENVGWSFPKSESLYNVFIMEEIQTILAVGAAASTKLVRTETPERPQCIRRIFNFKYPYEYLERFEELLQRKHEVIRFYKEEIL